MANSLRGMNIFIDLSLSFFSLSAVHRSPPGMDTPTGNV